MVTIQTVVHAASNASIKVHPYGATILSYISGDGREQLFLSGSAVLDGSKPIRGGIPVVFPIFGPPSGNSTMPQHGFARRSVWNVVKEYNDTESAGIVLELIVNKDTVDKDSVGTNNLWSEWIYNCTLQYTVDFSSKRLTCTLRIVNTGSSVSIPFEALLHTYYKVDDHKAMDTDICTVKGLTGFSISDKVLKESSSIQDDRMIIIPSIEVDRVYSPQVGNLELLDVLDVSIGVSISKSVRMVTVGYIVDDIELDENQGQKVPVSCVIWNPYKDKAAGMADFGDNEYHDMICVEPGILKNDDGSMQTINPGQVGVLQQTMYVLDISDADVADKQSDLHTEKKIRIG